MQVYAVLYKDWQSNEQEDQHPSSVDSRGGIYLETKDRPRRPIPARALPHLLRLHQSGLHETDKRGHAFVKSKNGANFAQHSFKVAVQSLQSEQSKAGLILDPHI